MFLTLTPKPLKLNTVVLPEPRTRVVGVLPAAVASMPERASRVTTRTLGAKPRCQSARPWTGAVVAG